MSFIRRLLMSTSTLQVPNLDLGADSSLSKDRRITCHFSGGTWSTNAGVTVQMLSRDCSEYFNKITVNGVEKPTNSTSFVTTGKDAQGQSTNWYGCTFWLKPGYTEVPSEMFKNIKYINRMDIKLAITKIGDYAFAGCPNVDNLMTYDVDYIINDKPYSNLVEIGKYAFQNTKITDVEHSYVVIPQFVRTIDTGAFQGATFSGGVEFQSNPTYIGSYAFSGTTIGGSKAFKMKFGPGAVIKENAFVGLNCYGYEFEFDNAIIEPGAFNNLKFKNASCGVTIKGTVNKVTNTSNIFTNVSSSLISDTTRVIGV